jgi:hypothetical protein
MAALKAESVGMAFKQMETNKNNPLDKPSRLFK